MLVNIEIPEIEQMEQLGPSDTRKDRMFVGKKQ